RIGISEVYRITGIAVTLQSANTSLAYYGIGCRRLRETSLYEALLNEAIARQAEYDPRAAYAAGLLRNYGRLLIDRVMQLYRPHGERFEDSGCSTLLEWERETFRTTGAEMGADLMARWHFPASVVGAVRHAAATESTRLGNRDACLLHETARICQEKGFGLPGEGAIWTDTPAMREVTGVDDDLLREAAAEA